MLVERTHADPRGTWPGAEAAAGQRRSSTAPRAERSTWLRFADAEREALASHDYVTLFEMGATTS